MAQQCPESLIIQTRDHAWVDTTDYSTKPYWERRRCPVCELEDMRLHDRSKPCARNAWEVTTPCIEPVKESVSYDELVAELKQYGVRERPYCMGVPGKWIVGFRTGQGSVCPMIEVQAIQTLDHGFARLVRWVRARQYRVNQYSNIDYLRKLEDHSCCCCDDD